jgi:DNA mismatch repair protein MutL
VAKILKLPQSEIDKICAGEVVERPASVVKELVENALDAGARRIEIEIEDGGKGKIVVTDDGSGIAEDEIPAALSQHCTSKIERAADLTRKHTLGFRGEALYSIAAISKLKLTSRRQHDSTGSFVYAEAGETVDSGKLAYNPGTSVEVTDLFFNTPVRRKFLKAKSTEVNFITQLLLEYALAYPEVAWRFASEGREVFATRGDGSIAEVLVKLFDAEAAREVLEVNYAHTPGIRAEDTIEGKAISLGIKGVIAKPQFHRSTRSGQHFFVNRRPVRNKLFFRAVDDGFREHMSPGKHGLCVLLLDVPPSEIDVNIHPSKYEVDFSNTQQIYGLMTAGIKRALAEGAADRKAKLAKIFRFDEIPAPVEHSPLDVPESVELAADFVEGAIIDFAAGKSIQKDGEYSRLPDFETAGSRMRAVPLYTLSAEKEPEIEENTSDVPSRSFAIASTGSAASFAEMELDIKKAIIVGQVANTYIVLLGEDAVYLIDQHSAHERIIFEGIYRQMTARSEGVDRQTLVFPMLLSIRPDQAKAAEGYLTVLNRLGFGAEVFGEDTLLLREVPALLADRISPDIFRLIVDELLVGGVERSYNEMVKHAAATAACKAAVKAGDPLGSEEMSSLVKSLTNAEDTFSCPHGRPTVIRLDVKEIGRMFRRT